MTPIFIVFEKELDCKKLISDEAKEFYSNLQSSVRPRNPYTKDTRNDSINNKTTSIFVHGGLYKFCKNEFAFQISGDLTDDKIQDAIIISVKKASKKSLDETELIVRFNVKLLIKENKSNYSGKLIYPEEVGKN